MTTYRHMNCPICTTKLKTINSRSTASRTATWRRKQCPKCKLVLTSRENLDLSSIIFVGNRPYSRSSLYATLSKIISKKSEEVLVNILETIELNLVKVTKPHNNKLELSLQIYDNVILKVLNNLDTGAHLRYQAIVQERSA